MIVPNVNKQDSFKYDVFLSHCSDSSLGFVERMADYLEEAGVTCWYAPRNLDKTGAGKEYDDEIVFAIRDSRCLVVILNDDALNSRWVKREVSQAEKQNKMIIPFAVSELSVNNGLLMRLEDRHIINAYPEPEKRMPVLLKNVKQLLGQDVSGIVLHEEKDVTYSNLNKVFDLDYEEGEAFMKVEQDKDAFLSFLRSAKNGNEKAADKLVEIAQNNSKNAQFLDDNTWEQIEELSDQGKGYADLLMYFRYYSMGTQNEVAVKYLMRSLKEYESPIAYLQLGICYRWGLGVKYSDVLSRNYFEMALDKGCGLACRYLGQLYLYGGESIEKDLVKAEEYLKKGVEMKANRCFQLLYNLYLAKNEKEKVRETARQMIDQNVKGGCSLMGDYYFDVVNDFEQAEEWYKKAIRNKENDAWGNLALLFLSKGEKKEAFRLANKGYWENDSTSFYVLGLISEQDDDIAKAWDYYHQSFLKFGIGAQQLGRIYFEKGYLPDSFELTDLKHVLELSSRQANLESIKYLLKIMLQESGKDTSLCYENIKDMPETYSFVRLGAKEDADMQFIYGRLLLESEGRMHNPYVGIDFVERATVNGNPSAAIYAINYYRKDSDTTKISKLSQYVVNCNSYAGPATCTVIDCYCGEKDETYIKWLYKSLRNLVYEDTNLFFDCFTDFRHTIEDSKGELERWLSKAVDEFFEFNDNTTAKLITPFYAYLMAVKLSLEKEKHDSNLLSFIRDDMDLEGNMEHMSKVHCYKDSVRLIWPDYTEDNVLNGDFSNERDLRIFYGTKNETIPDVLDGDCSRICDINSIVAEDANYPYQEMAGLEETKTKGFFCAYSDLFLAYQKLRVKGDAWNIEGDLRYDCNKDLVCCSIGKALQYGLNSLKILIASRGVFGKDWQKIVDSLNNVNRLFSILDTITDTDAHALLCAYCDFIVKRDELLLFDIRLEHSANNAFIAETINAIIDELDENNIQHELNHVTEDNLPGSIKEMTNAIGTFACTVRNASFLNE